MFPSDCIQSKADSKIETVFHVIDNKVRNGIMCYTLFSHFPLRQPKHLLTATGDELVLHCSTYE